jgi:hypothetical protein
MNQSLFDNLDRRPDSYDIGVDYSFFDAHDVEYIHHQPWQIGLFHPDLIGKFLWYPNAGTLVFEGDRGFQRIGEKGDFPGRADMVEQVYDQIMVKIIQQQNV